MHGMLGDVRLALRLLRKSPLLTLAAVLTLALGVGANVALFGVVRSVLLAPLPFAGADRLVMVWETDAASHTRHEPASWPDVADMRAATHTLSGIASMMAAPATLTGAGEAERVAALAVTPDLPAVLGVRPLLGRGFLRDEGRAGAPRVALLGEELWRRRFAADAGVLGRRLVLDGEPVTIVGVLPADADLGIREVHAHADYAEALGGARVELWLATQPSAAEFPRSTHPWLTIGRLAPGASVASAQAELGALMARLERAFPENAHRGVRLEPYETVVLGTTSEALRVLVLAVALVLLVACGNVAALLLARATERSREVAVRRALGAPTARLVRQLLVESAALTVLASAVGLLLAWAALRQLVLAAAAMAPRLAGAHLDLPAFGFASAVAALVTVACGLAPLLASRHDLRGGMRGGRGATAERSLRRMRDLLVVAEVAMAVVLVIGAGLLMRTFWRLASVDPGFRVARVVKAEYELPAGHYPMDYKRWPQLPAIQRFQSELLQGARALPGVDAAALAARHPLDPGFTNSFVVVGREAEARDWPEIRCRVVSPGYLDTLGVPLLAGRALREGDVAGAAPVAMINRAAERRYFGGRDPQGQRVAFWGVRWQIVGVVGDERFLGLDKPPEPAVYVSMAQAPMQAGVLLVRSSLDERALARSLRRLGEDVDAGVALHGIEPLALTLDSQVARPRFLARLLALFGTISILLALVGIYGAVQYAVAQRRRELSLRLALGATHRRILAMVLGDGAALAATGTLMGVAISLAASRLLSRFVFGITSRDGATYLVVALGVLALSTLASCLPARRAARLEARLAIAPE